MQLGFMSLTLITNLILAQNLMWSNDTSHRFGADSSRRISYENASALLVDLLKDYDIRLRPGFGGDALHLTIDIIIASFDSISEVDMDYTLTMYLHQYWTDERLSWRRWRDESTDTLPIDEMTLNGEFSSRIWVPDTFLANDKRSYLHEVTERNKMLRIDADGHVAYGMRLTSTLSCSMNLRNFPLDAQNCTVEVESYGYTTSEVLMKWNTPKAVHGVEQVDVPQFTITGCQTENSIVSTATGSYQRLSLVFQLHRSVGYFIFQTYLPCVLIVMLSWVSFWINHEATSARVALGITTVLTMTTISTGVRQSLPRISYVKSIDVYLVMCFVFVFAALLEYAAVNYSYWGRERAANHKSWNKEDRESAVNVQKWMANRNQAPKQSVAKQQEPRAESPIPSLCAHTNSLPPDADPDYPRVRRRQPTVPAAPGVYHRRRRRRFDTNIGAKLSVIGRRACRAIPSLRVRDVNLIDRYSRIIFPVCFVIFNTFYWSYYTMVSSAN